MAKPQNVESSRVLQRTVQTFKTSSKQFKSSEAFRNDGSDVSLFGWEVMEVSMGQRVFGLIHHCITPTFV